MNHRATITNEHQSFTKSAPQGGGIVIDYQRPGETLAEAVERSFRMWPLEDGYSVMTIPAR
jgi:hypothetical protein